MWTADASTEFLRTAGAWDRGFVDRHSRVAFSGGPGGIRHDPRPEERFADRDQHMGRTSFQQQHQNSAMGDRNSYMRNNGGRPQNPAVTRPLGAEHMQPGNNPGRGGFQNNPNPQSNMQRGNGQGGAAIKTMPIPGRMRSPEITQAGADSRTMRNHNSPSSAVDSPSSFSSVTHNPSSPTRSSNSLSSAVDSLSSSSSVTRNPSSLNSAMRNPSSLSNVPRLVLSQIRRLHNVPRLNRKPNQGTSTDANCANVHTNQTGPRSTVGLFAYGRREKTVERERRALQAG